MFQTLLLARCEFEWSWHHFVEPTEISTQVRVNHQAPNITQLVCSLKDNLIVPEAFSKLGGSNRECLDQAPPPVFIILRLQTGEGWQQHPRHNSNSSLLLKSKDFLVTN
jgi:hypothetical protein